MSRGVVFVVGFILLLAFVLIAVWFLNRANVGRLNLFSTNFFSIADANVPADSEDSDEPELPRSESEEQETREVVTTNNCARCCPPYGFTTTLGCRDSGEDTVNPTTRVAIDESLIKCARCCPPYGEFREGCRP